VYERIKGEEEDEGKRLKLKAIAGEGREATARLKGERTRVFSIWKDKGSDGCSCGKSNGWMKKVEMIVGGGRT
jgi:hypothetical protein